MCLLIAVFRVSLPDLSWFAQRWLVPSGSTMSGGCNVRLRPKNLEGERQSAEIQVLVAAGSVNMILARPAFLA
jgi:hypothetical protein